MNTRVPRRPRFAALATALLCAGAVCAQEIVHPDGDVFDTPPTPASAAGKEVCRTAQRYVDNVNAGRYAEQGALFTENAVFVTPTGQVLHGSAEIGAFYRNLLGKLVPTIIPLSFIADGSECVMELAAITQFDGERKYKLAAIDHFTMDTDGRIRHMVVYVRPDSIATQRKAQ